MSATIFYAGSPYQDLVFVLLEPFISGTRRVHYFEDLEEAKDDVARLGARCVLLRSSNDHARDGTMSQDDFIRDYLRCSTDSRRKPADLCAVSPEDYCWPENYHDIGPPKQVFVVTCSLFDRSGLRHLVEQWEQGVIVLGDPELHGAFVEDFGIYTPNPNAGHKERRVLRNPKFAKALSGVAAAPLKRSVRLKTTTAASVQAPASVDGLVEEAAPAPVNAPSLYDGVDVGRRSAAQMTSLEDVTFTAKNLKTAAMQKLLTEKLENFLLVDFPADPSTKLPFKTSKADREGPRNEVKVVADFLNAGKTGAKKKKAEAMLRAVCELRGVQSEYFKE